MYESFAYIYSPGAHDQIVLPSRMEWDLYLAKST